MKLSDLKRSGHLPTLISAFLYFDFSFMIWTVLGPLGAQVGETLHLSPDQKGLMVAVPILSGAFLRILLGLLVDRIGSKRTGLIAQAIVICGLLGVRKGSGHRHRSSSGRPMHRLPVLHLEVSVRCS